MAKKGSSRQTPKRTTSKPKRNTKAVKTSAIKTSAAKTKKKSSRKTHLSAAELKVFRQMLIEKRHSLLGDMSGMEAAAFRSNRHDNGGELSNVPIHPADVGSDNYEQEFTLGLLESERLMLAEIHDALLRIDEGTYGICLGTSKPINKARLRARPWAKYCIEYARLLEKGLATPPDDDDDDDDDDDEMDVQEQDDEPVVEDDERVEDESED